jgi:hypothetical protein
MSELLFGFRDLINSSEPSNRSLFDFSSILFNDDYLKKLNSKRYNFYVKFVLGLSNPIALEKFFYKTKESRDFKDDYLEKVKKFNLLLNKLYENIDPSKKQEIISNIKETIKNKYKFSDNIVDKLDPIFEKTSEITKGGADSDFSALNTNEFTEFKKDIMNNDLNTGRDNMRKFINAIDNVAPDLGMPKPMEKVDDLLLSAKEKEIRNQAFAKKKSDLIKDISPIYNKFKGNLNPSNLQISTIDRIIFIAITFILRFITLMIIDWGLTTNLINSFYSAFFYYCSIYILFFVFITMIVNVVVYYPLLTLFSNINIITIPNYLYYFYIYTNGYSRLLLHIFIILLILFIPYIINIDKLSFLKIENNKPNISYDYEKKRKINDAISFFSLIIWIITTIVAIKF